MTRTVHLSKFLPMVLPHVKECPQAIATFNLRLAAIEFCERTRCWRHLTTTSIGSNGQGLCAPPYAAIHLIEKATFEGRKLEPIQFSDVDETQFANSEGSNPLFVTQAQYNTIRILPFKEGDVSLSLFLKPVNGNDMMEDEDGIVVDAFDVVPEFIYKMHAEAIAAGALGRLMIQSEKPWTNPQMGMAWGGRAEQAMEQHFSVSLTGQQRAKRRTHYHDF